MSSPQTSDPLAASVIVSYYKAPGVLRLIMDAFARQSRDGFEVIISEDDNNPQTVDLVDQFRGEYNFPIKHVRQDKDDGFRKCEMLNKSTVAARGKLLIFIDGDCIPHRHFIRSYLKNARPGIALCGRRVMLGQSVSEKIKSGEYPNDPGFIRLLFTKTTKLKEAIYSPLFSLTVNNPSILGCNWGVYKQHLLEINGFDEDFVNHISSEDTDIEWRLAATGVKTASVKNKAIVYHLYHPLIYNKEIYNASLSLVEKKQKLGHARCLNGIEKLS